MKKNPTETVTTQVKIIVQSISLVSHNFYSSDIFWTTVTSTAQLKRTVTGTAVIIRQKTSEVSYKVYSFSCPCFHLSQIRFLAMKVRHHFRKWIWMSQTEELNISSQIRKPYLKL